MAVDGLDVVVFEVHLGVDEVVVVRCLVGADVDVVVVVVDDDEAFVDVVTWASCPAEMADVDDDDEVVVVVMVLLGL